MWAIQRIGTENATRNSACATNLNYALIVKNDFLSEKRASTLETAGSVYAR